MFILLFFSNIFDKKRSGETLSYIVVFPVSRSFLKHQAAKTLDTL
jgi:hypothetical protein